MGKESTAGVQNNFTCEFTAKGLAGLEGMVSRSRLQLNRGDSFTVMPGPVSCSKLYTFGYTATSVRLPRLVHVRVGPN